VDNAIKYSKNDPSIQIDLQEKENTIVVSINDNGIGIPPEYHGKIFDKFFRIPHGDTHNAKGYGLGLSYVAQVIKKHNGTIAIKSQPGEGTQFTITLPKQTV
jgi:two-component system phosphate regulon sensor histidine kinase PhoR